MSYDLFLRWEDAGSCRSTRQREEIEQRWLWLSCQSGRFQLKSTVVRIQSSAKKIENKKKKEGPGKGHLKNSGNRHNELSLKEEVPPYYGTQYLLMYLPIRCCRVGSTMDIRHRRPGFDSYQVVSVTGWLNYILVNIWSLTTM